VDNAVEECYDAHEGQSIGRRILSVLRGNRGRILTVCFVIYLIALVRVGSAGAWISYRGFEWTSPAYQLFPIPINWYDFGAIVAQVFVPMSFPDIILYVVFVGNYIWLVWGILSITYIIHRPIIIRIKNRIPEVLNRSP
jgi:hypothetical protein